MQSRTFTYDSLSQLLSAYNPESGTVQYPLYDANGNLERRIDARGTRTDYLYDNLDRLTSKTYTIALFTAPTPNVTYTYDTLPALCNAKGRLTSTSSSAATTTIGCYDAMGRPTQTSQTTASATYPFTYAYDLAGNLISQQYPSGKTILTTIDAAGRIKTVQRQSAGFYAGDATIPIKYAPHGAIQQAKLGNGLWEQAQYNKRLQTNQLGIGGSVDSDPNNVLTTTHANLLLLGNCFNANIDPNCSGTSTVNNGNVWRHRIQAPGLSRTQTFTYDPLNRLTSVTEDGGGTPCVPNGHVAQTYGHDRYGNHWVPSGASCGAIPALTPTAETFFAPGGPNTSPTNRLLTSVYDAAGNLTTDASGRTFTYDAENRQASYNGGLGTATYQYDGDGKRVMHFLNGVTTIFVYDVSGRLAAEYSLTSSPPPASTRYLTTDHLGSTRIVTSATGSMLSRHDYLPYGDEIAATFGGRSSIAGYGVTTNIRQKFTGKERDQESGPDYFLARYYSGAQGRFTSPDEFKGGIADPFTGKQVNQSGPLPYSDITDPQTLNKYAYVRNNPLRYVDPDGHCIWDLCIGEGTAVYVAAGATLAAAAYISTPQGQAQTREFISSIAAALTLTTTAVTETITSFFAKDAEAGQLQKAGKDAIDKASGTIEKAAADIARFKNPADVQKHIDDLKKGIDVAKDLMKNLDKAKGKIRDQVKEELKKAIDQIKGHEKDLRQKK